MGIADSKYIAFTTFKKSGDAVTSPVWVVPVSDGRAGFETGSTTWKVKRLRNNDRITVQPCNINGKPTPGTTPQEGTAEVVDSGPLFDEVKRGVAAKYGLMARVLHVGETLAAKVKRQPVDPAVAVLISLPD